MPIRITEEYAIEKVEAFTVAIDALRQHESPPGVDAVLATQLREQLARRLEREINDWCVKHRDVLQP
jgi:histidinol dehydrogenase